jgi:hypothetical protein
VIVVEVPEPGGGASDRGGGAGHSGGGACHSGSGASASHQVILGADLSLT